MFKWVFSLLALVGVVACPWWGAAASGRTIDYGLVSGKARLFFDNADWQSAAAMYDLLIEADPRSSDVYAHAITTEYMLADTTAAIGLVPTALDNRVPLDSLMADVRTTTFGIGKTNLYERFLLDIKQHLPWAARIADNHLMRYYDFRNNGPELIAYAERMLDGLPDDVVMLRMLARGYLLDGKTDKAVSTWEHVLQLDPDNYPTLLDLGNCLLAAGMEHEGVVYLRRANDIKSTPYVAKMLKEPVK